MLVAEFLLGVNAGRRDAKVIHDCGDQVSRGRGCCGVDQAAQFKGEPDRPVVGGDAAAVVAAGFLEE